MVKKKAAPKKKIEPIPEIQFDIRTRRPIKEVKPRYAAPQPKDDAKLMKAKQLFHDLIQHPVYQEIRGLAYASCISNEPASLDGGISWMYAAVKRSAYDSLFNKIEDLGAKPVFPEDQPVVNRYRPSFYAENDNIPEDGI